MQTTISPREILEEFDTLVTEALIAGLTREQAEERVKIFQRGKYSNSSSENEK